MLWAAEVCAQTSPSRSPIGCCLHAAGDRSVLAAVPDVRTKRVCVFTQQAWLPGLEIHTTEAR